MRYIVPVVRVLMVSLALFYSAHVGNAQTTMAGYVDPHGKPIQPEFDPKTGGVRKIQGLKEKIQDYGYTKTHFTKASLRQLGKKLVDDYSKILKITSQDLDESTIDTGGAWQVIQYRQRY